MPNLTQANLVRRVALRMGYAGADFEATGNTALIIKDAVSDAHAELTELGKVSWDIDETPQKYASALVRYMANLAESYVDRSRSAGDYEQEEVLAYKALCRVVVVDQSAFVESDDPVPSRAI